MADRPSRIWKDMPFEKRVLAAEAFWRDDDSSDVRVQQMEAVVTLARRMNFRTRSIQALPVAPRARHLAQVDDVGDSVATRALIAYHFTHQRPLMAAFLDALGIAHDDGVIRDEQIEAPERDRIVSAVATVAPSFDASDLDMYLRTLAAVDGDTWSNLDGVLNGRP